MKLPLAIFAVSAMIGLAAPATADTPPVAGDDAGSLGALQQTGISYASPDAAVGAGKAVCHCLNHGESGLELIHDVKMHNPGFDMESASNFAPIAAQYYCPHQLSKA